MGEMKKRLGPKEVCLTFDDGPGDSARGKTIAIAEFLHCEGIAATFFVVGHRIESAGGRETLKRLVQLGHSIGNHTFSHPDLPTLMKQDGQAVVRELVQTHHLIEEFVEGKLLTFRPPFGTWDEAVAEAMGSVKEFEAYHGPITWHFEGHDWDLGRGVDGEMWTVDDCQNKITDQFKTSDRGVILLHDGLADKIQDESHFRRDALVFELVKSLVGWLKREGYRFVSLDSLILE